VFRCFVELGGWGSEGSEGTGFMHDAVGWGLVPIIRAQFLSDVWIDKERWFPSQATVGVKLDTGADVTCMHSNWIRNLALKPDKSEATCVTAMNGETVIAYRKFASVRIAGIFERITIPILFSDGFRENLINFSMKALVDHYGVVLNEERTILFPK
jgi:hypothetical protein